MSRKLTTPEFIAKAKEVHGDKYDYSKTVYVNAKTKITITCPEHGDFEQTACGHGNGAYGCSKCGDTTMISKRFGHFTDNNFIDKARLVHGDNYDYSKTVYVGGHEKVIITCPAHGDFEQTPSNHLRDKGCKKCANGLSKNEDYIVNTLREMGEVVIQSDRSVIKPKELDIYIPEHKLAIEYNGMKWHTEQFNRDKDYHLNKTRLCSEKGIRLIHVWEDEFVKNPEAHVELITRIISPKSNKRVKAELVTDKKHVKNILNEHHIKGCCNFSIAIGLYQGGKLQAVTCFTKRGTGYKLVRHLNIGNIDNALRKTVKFFNHDIQVDCDMSVNNVDDYKQAGFKVSSVIKPDYQYVVKQERQNKTQWSRKLIEERLPFFFDKESTAKEMMVNTGIFRIWDCGSVRLTY